MSNNNIHSRRALFNTSNILTDIIRFQICAGPMSRFVRLIYFDHLSANSIALGVDSKSLIHSSFAADRTTTRLLSLLANLKHQLD